jgi:hypothetical protein
MIEDAGHYPLTARAPVQDDADEMAGSTALAAWASA